MFKIKEPASSHIVSMSPFVPGQSATVQLIPGPSASRWLQKVTDQLQREKNSCAAPETYEGSYQVTVERLLNHLQTGNPVVVHDVSRELSRAYRLNQVAFAAAALDMFGNNRK